jgi:hypothetical protein
MDATQRIKKIIAERTADARTIRADLLRGTFTPDTNDRHSARARNSSIGDASLRLEMVELELHRLRQLEDQAFALPAEVSAALDTLEGKQLNVQNVGNPAAARRMAAELAKPTNPFDPRYEEDPTFTANYNAEEHEFHEQADRFARLPQDDQQAIAQESWLTNPGFVDGFDGRYTEENVHEAVATWTGTSDPQGFIERIAAAQQQYAADGEVN